MTSRQIRFIYEMVNNGEDAEAAALAAGYKLRGGATVSALKKHAGIQAAIGALLDKKLMAAPSKEGVYKTINQVKQMCLRNPDCQWSGALLLKATELEMKSLGMFSEQPPAAVTEVDARHITVNFVEPEQAGRLNASAAEFEQRHRLPAGSLGRLSPEGEQEAGPELLPPSEPVPVPAYVQPLTDAERRRLSKLAMPLGGALSGQHCRVHGEYEARWVQAADLTWGWSECPHCWESVAVQ
jgi:hypothetical protein